MKTATFFETEDELRQLTGLNYEELWEHGFDLDDWNWGFASIEEWHKEGDFDDDYYHELPDYEEWLMQRMDDWCVGYEHVEYDGKHYYMIYHA